MKIDITGIPKELILMHLYNNSHTTMGLDITPDGTTLDHAKRLTDECLSYDWLNGRALMIHIGSDLVDPTNYDQERRYESRKYGLRKPKTFKEIIQSLK
jgi:hypothetical protein